MYDVIYAPLKHIPFFFTTGLAFKDDTGVFYDLLFFKGVISVRIGSVAKSNDHKFPSTSVLNFIGSGGQACGLG